MNKRVFIAQLKLELRGVSDQEIADIINDYEHYFHEAMESGMTEEDAVESLGPPGEVAEKVKADLGQSRSRSPNAIVIIGLLFFNLIFVLGPFMGVVGLVFGLFVTTGAFIVSPILVILTMLIGNKHIFELFVSLTLSGIGLLLLPLLVKGIKSGFDLVERYVQWNMRQIRGEAQ